MVCLAGGRQMRGDWKRLESSKSREVGEFHVVDDDDYDDGVASPNLCSRGDPDVCADERPISSHHLSAPGRLWTCP